MSMDYMTVLFMICSIMIGIVSGSLVADSCEERRWSKAIVGLVMLVMHVIVLVCYYRV